MEHLRSKIKERSTKLRKKHKEKLGLYRILRKFIPNVHEALDPDSLYGEGKKIKSKKS